MKRDELLEDVFLATEATQRAWKALFHDLIGKEQISPSQAYALFALENFQPIKNKDFAKRMQLTPGAVTQLIDSLGNFVERTHDDNDRRIVHLSVSKAGKKFMHKIRQKRKAIFMEAMHSFSEKELLIMLKHQQEILAKIETI